jgi:hypothetical protein
MKVKSSEGIVDAFNTVSLTSTENLNLHQEMRCDAISFSGEAFPRKFLGMQLGTATTENEIKSIKHSFKAETSSGYDGITSKFFKVCTLYSLG